MSGRRELVWIRDLTDTQVDAIGHGFLSLSTDVRLDQSEQFSFEIPADHPKAYRLAADVGLVHRGRRYFVTEVEQSRRGSESTVRVEADAEWYRLGHDTYVGSFVLDAVTPKVGLSRILAGTSWDVNSVTTATAETFSMEQQDRSWLQLLRVWAKITGTFLAFDTASRTVSIADTRGTARGLAFRYGRNLRTVRRRTRPPELTRIYPYGADGLTIAGINGGAPYVEDLTYYTDQGLTAEQAQAFTRGRPWSDTSFIRDVDLLPAAVAKLAAESIPLVEYTLDVIDLSEVTNVVEDVEPGDTVGVADPAFTFDLRPIVSRYRHEWLEPWRNRIELATILPTISDGSSSARPSSSTEWRQFVGPVRADYEVRNDGDYIVARIPLQFRDGGRANYHLDLWAIGVGAGDMVVTVEDAEDADAQQFHQVVVPYTNGEPVRAVISWATEELTGAHDYRVVVTTVASGGASPTNGVDIANDLTTREEASWWILAQGAVQETPTETNSETFEYTGAVQTFTVPDNVFEISLIVKGAAGSGLQAGGGGMISATAPVIPGTIYDVNVGGTTGWPNGGAAGVVGGGTPGRSGGGSSDVRPTGAGLATALIVAAGGGGEAHSSASNPNPTGGDGGYLAGLAGTGGLTPGGGATQFAGGTAGVGSAGSFGQGGTCTPSANAFVYGGGGGGGGWYGGGCGRTDLAPDQSGAGGGSGWVDFASGLSDVEIADGSVTGHGQVVISWETPLI